MASVSPSSPQESSSERETESPPPSSSTEQLLSSSSTEHSPSSSSSQSPVASSPESAPPPLLPELKALREPGELSLDKGLPDNASILRYCRLIRRENHVGKMSDFLLSKKVAEDLMVLWGSVVSQFSGSRLMEPHNIQKKVKNLMVRYKFAFTGTTSRIATKQQKALSRDAPNLFDIRSCR